MHQFFASAEAPICRRSLVDAKPVEAVEKGLLAMVTEA